MPPAVALAAGVGCWCCGFGLAPPHFHQPPATRPHPQSREETKRGFAGAKRRPVYTKLLGLRLDLSCPGVFLVANCKEGKSFYQGRQFSCQQCRRLRRRRRVRKPSPCSHGRLAAASPRTWPSLSRASTVRMVAFEPSQKKGSASRLKPKRLVSSNQPTST